MKKTRISGLLTILLLMVLCSGCSKKDNETPVDPDNSVLLRISAIIISNGNPTYATSVGVGVVDENNSGFGVEGAVVKVNGMADEDVGNGSYTLLLSSNPLTAGTGITLTVGFGDENCTVSTVMPGNGESISVEIPGCATSSFISVGNNI